MVYKPLQAAICSILFLPAMPLLAQTSRILGAIDPDQVVQMPGLAPFQGSPQFDRGAVDPSFQLTYITLYAKPSPDRQQALDRLLAAQQDRSSPLYHHWLTPEQYADRFGLTVADLDKIADWLQAEGFTIRYRSRGRDWIAFSGTAGQVARTFRTEIHRYEMAGETHVANSSRPSLPAALAGVVTGLRGLNDFHPKSLVPRPRYTNSSEHYLAPGDIATIYNLNPLYNTGIDGSGQTLVVVGQSDVYATDIADFRAAFGLPAQTLQVFPNCSAGSLCTLLTGDEPGVTGDLDEGELDLEWSGAIARNAEILYAYSTDALSSAFYAIDNNLGSVLSMSYGACEADYSQLDDGTLDMARSEAQKGNTMGITWLASSGDAGPAACDWNGPSTGRKATQGLAVNVPASIPEVTGVGGTEFQEASGNYWSSNNGTGGGSALSYIPELAWNDTVFGFNTSSTLLASGGGVSSYYPVPAWQTGASFPNDGGRDLPDVALAASPDHDPFIICFKHSSCFNQSGQPNAASGGTSVAAPIFAGVIALMNQYLVSLGSQAGVGNINPTLYALMATSAFHDIVTGSNIVPCATNSPDCVNGRIGYYAGPGYDEVTGLGSIDAYNLLLNWAAQTVTYTISGTVALTDGGTSQFLSGVAVTLSGSQTGSTTTSSSGAFSFTVAALGSYTVSPSQAGYTFTPSSLTFNNVTGSETAAFSAVTTLALVLPFGSFDTPAASTSNVSGALPFTGWALSPAGITAVDIWREPNPGETAQSNGLIYIGPADLVAGSRTDVQALYPNYPGAASAGWGYMLLTNELPSNGGNSGVGNGAYRIHALAHDAAAQTTDLGVKTIAVNNAGASAPFGTIDTPAQGGTASGSSYVNFGWALTPLGKDIPADGSTIVVYIDNLPVGHPVYGQYREDIATLFPNYVNSQGAVGYFYIDTTKLTNGVHSIAWSVTDSAGVASGIGSRYFTVQN
jgi:subtilase family serine protease